MENAFLICAAGGGMLLLCLFIAGLLGFGADTEADAHGDFEQANWLFGLLSLRALGAAFLFFGIGGMIALRAELDDWSAFGIALGAGVAALYLVTVLMKSLHRLKADGTARIDRAVGRTGTVYLRIPAEKSAAGKVHVNLQNRTVEYQAVTAGNELPTGTPIRVVAVINSDTVEVVAA